MKKNFITALFVICIVSLFGFMSCSDAIVNDGSNIRSYVGTSGDSDVGESGGVVPFSKYHDVFDLQIWEGTFTADISDSMAVTIGSGAWFGGVICSKGDGTGPKYDMSKIKSITFEGRAETKLKVRLFTSGPDTKPYDDHFDASLTDEWQSFEWTKTKGSATDVGIFGFNGDCGGWKNGDVFYIRNIAFFDESGNEIVPLVN